MIRTILIALFALLALAPLTGCSTAAAPRAVVMQCAVAADLAPQIKADNVDPQVAGVDCRSTLAAANVPMLGLKKPSDPAGTPGLNHIYQFKTIDVVDANTVRVTFDYTCNVWCGHGEEATAIKRDGHWVISDRKTTWIS